MGNVKEETRMTKHVEIILLCENPHCKFKEIFYEDWEVIAIYGEGKVICRKCGMEDGFSIKLKIKED